MPSGFKHRKTQPQSIELSVVPSDEEQQADVLKDHRFKTLVECISDGCSTTHACALAGLDMSYVCTLINEDKPSFRKPLLTLINKAKATYYKKHLDKLTQAQDWKASAFWLERHEPDFFLSKQPLVSVTQVNGKQEISLDPEQLKRLSEAYDKEMNPEPKALPEPTQEDNAA